MHFNECSPFLIIVDLDNIEMSTKELMDALSSNPRSKDALFIGLTNDALKIKLITDGFSQKMITLNTPINQSWLAGFVESSILLNPPMMK